MPTLAFADYQPSFCATGINGSAFHSHVTDHDLLLFVLILRSSLGHHVELQFHPSFTYYPSVMILRGPSGGHCAEL